jgi:tetratricopeptide (TPR) repeat protein
MTTEQVFQRVLNTDVKAFDKKFDDYLRTRFASVLPSVAARDTSDARATSVEALEREAQARPTDFGAQLLAGEALAERGDADRAIPLLERARDIFPEYGGKDSPYALLAPLYGQKGDLRKQADALLKLTSLAETNLPALIELATVQEKLGDLKGAADALDRAMYINPFDANLHKQLADVSRSLGDKQRAIRERAAIVALGPVDKADALYQLALAQHEAGEDGPARKSVLRALEDAPNYEKAQALLLELYDARMKDSVRKTP